MSKKCLPLELPGFGAQTGTVFEVIVKFHLSVEKKKHHYEVI